MNCSMTYAKLNLTTEQKTKMDAAEQECRKDGCTKESMDKFMQTAKGILSADQYAQLQSECARLPKTEKKS